MKFNLGFYGRVILANLILGLVWFSAYFWKFWELRPYDYLSLVFVQEVLIVFSALPINIFIVNQINKDKKDSQQFHFALSILIVFLALSLYGQGMHNAANQIRTLVDEPIIYFYDELLSHWIGTAGLLGIIFLLGIMQLNAPYKVGIGKKEKLFLIISGIFLGLVIGVASAEAHFGQMGLFMSAIAATTLTFKVKGKEFEKYPLTWHYLYLFGAMTVFFLVWILLTGGFAEPSHVGFGRF